MCEPLYAGMTLGPWTLGTKLGAGEFGTVYEGATGGGGGVGDVGKVNERTGGKGGGCSTPKPHSCTHKQNQHQNPTQQGHDHCAPLMPTARIESNDVE